MVFRKTENSTRGLSYKTTSYLTNHLNPMIGKNNNRINVYKILIANNTCDKIKSLDWDKSDRKEINVRLISIYMIIMFNNDDVYYIKFFLLFSSSLPNHDPNQ